MTSIHTYDPTTARHRPHCHRCRSARWRSASLNLLQEAADLPQPRYIALFDPQ